MPAKRLRVADVISNDPVTEQLSTEAPQKSTAALELLHAKVTSPSVSGIQSMAVNSSEDRLVVAREDGSLVLFKLDFFQNVCHLIKLSSTGGRKNRSIRSVHFALRDSAIVVTYLSGQYVLFDSVTLLPSALHERTGGPILNAHVSHSGSLIFSAIGDGSIHCVTIRSLTRMDLSAIFPKVSGANRTLCVFSSEQSGVVVGGDDAGHISCWATSAVTENLKSDDDVGRGVISGNAQQWCTKLGTGIPMAVIVHAKSATCAVGTSIGEVVLINLQSGSVVSSFTHHRGPVTVLALGSDEQSFFATGYHESLRCYRQQQSTGAWHPADVRRRTHYHEATAVCVLENFPFLFSAARDGTIMHSRLATLFSAPVQYADVSTQSFVFANDRNALLQSSSTALQVLRLNARRTQWIPLFQFVPEGPFLIKAAWANSDLSKVAFATDVRVAVFALDWEENNLSVKGMRPLFSKSVVGVHDCFFHVNDVYVLTSFAVWHLPQSIGYKAIEHSNLPGGPYHRIVVAKGTADAALVRLFGQQGSLCIPTNDDGTLRADDAAALSGDQAAADFVSYLGEDGVAALVGGKQYNTHVESASSDPLIATLPHDTTIVGTMSSGYLGSFSRGIVDASKDQWRMIKRMPIVKAFALASSGRQQTQGTSCLALERNIEGAVETLPSCWKVRRFGN